MDIAALLIFGGALAINAGMPGPSIAALVARVLASGPRDVIPFLAAMWIGEGLWLRAAAFGLSFLAQSFHAGFIVLKYCGVAYLIYLAWKMWRAAGRQEGEEISPQGSPLQMFVTGLAITFGNPKLMVFYLALLPSIVNLETLTVTGFGTLLLTMMAVLAGVDLAWVLLAHGARRLIRSRRGVKVVNRSGAAAMGGAAVAIATR
ncbi:MAG TPA: LysE family translocator, partial [Aestuariivirgaceae bacterium]|nr:LysE family translocator [Aestuariivirgaceae bacterium]